MRTMSWQELGFSSGKVRLKKLFERSPIDIYDEPTELEFIVEKMVIGGFPTLLNKGILQAEDLNRAYVELLAEVDMSRVSNIRRDPVRVRSLLRALARNTATLNFYLSTRTKSYLSYPNKIEILCWLKIFRTP